ncbi:hypothetical protein ACN28I_44355 [Archangium gephyra]|uniref:hypothetical protein n=1 Tax=Archangium gephyra TaxID=48 RepID=UPI003B7B2B80
MSTRLLASGSLVLLLAACATPTATSEGKAPGPSPVSQPAPPAVEDRSLGLEQYVELGVPSAEGSWDGEDYVLAAQALAAIAQKNPAELPRYQSTRSGPLFARLTAFENVDAIEKLEVAPLARVQLAGSVMEPVSQILMLYIGANENGSFSTEMIELPVLHHPCGRGDDGGDRPGSSRRHPQSPGVRVGDGADPDRPGQRGDRLTHHALGAEGVLG